MSSENKAVNPIAPYFGGNRLLSKRIVALINSIDHALYAEPFVGMGGIFLRRTIAAKTEIINDYARDVSNLFRVLQRHYEPLVAMLRYQVAGRAEFDRLLAVDPETLTDLERAARFIYIQRLAFGGKISGRSFGLSTTAPSQFDLTKLVPRLDAVHRRLSRVVIECLPYDQFIPRYDRPDTLFYLDPPYHGCETDYGRGMFARADFERISDLLKTLKGRFILSINDHPAIRAIFDQFTIHEVETTYSITRDPKAKKVTELIITN